jgi:hypothetical protein
MTTRIPRDADSKQTDSQTLELTPEYDKAVKILEDKGSVDAVTLMIKSMLTKKDYKELRYFLEKDARLLTLEEILGGRIAL